MAVAASNAVGLTARLGSWYNPDSARRWPVSEGIGDPVCGRETATRVNGAVGSGEGTFLGYRLLTLTARASFTGPPGTSEVWEDGAARPLLRVLQIPLYPALDVWVCALPVCEPTGLRSS